MNQKRRNFLKTSAAAAVAPAIASSNALGQAAADSVSYGDIVTLSNTKDISGRGSTGKLGIYDKGPLYLIFGPGKDPKSGILQATSWQIMKSITDTGSGPLNYGDPFYLLNVDKAKFASDNKEGRCFDGADGYFGLSKVAQGCANSYKLTKANSSGPIPKGTGDLVLACASGTWKCDGKTLTLYAFNEAVYLVWDSEDEPTPTVTIDVVK